MNTQQNQNEIKKKGQVQVNPSRDLKYDEKEKDFSGEFEEQIESAGQEVNAGELDVQKSQGDRDAFDQGVQNAGSKGSAQGYEGNTPDTDVTSDLGGDMSRTSGQAKGSDLGNRQGLQKNSDQKVKQKQDNSRIQ